jgi:hypothetical protein
MGIKMIKCPNCGVFNTNRDFCENCSHLLSEDIKRIQKEGKVGLEEYEKAVYEKENPNFVERMKKHPFFLYQALGWVLYSITMVISIIGSALAWFIAMVAAG